MTYLIHGSDIGSVKNHIVKLINLMSASHSGEIGEFFLVANLSAIARLLFDWLQVPENALYFALSGWARVERYFSFASMVQAYKNLYDQQLSIVWAETD